MNRDPYADTPANKRTHGPFFTMRFRSFLAYVDAAAVCGVYAIRDERLSYHVTYLNSAVAAGIVFG